MVVGDILHMFVVFLVVFGYVLLCVMKLGLVWQVVIGLILLKIQWEMWVLIVVAPPHRCHCS